MPTDSREFNLSGLERVVSGPGSVERLPHELERRGLERAVVVTGRTLGASALLDRVTGPLGRRCVAVFTDARQHVPSCSVAQVTTLLQEHHADAVISFGGGSPIDTAKAALYNLIHGGSSSSMAQPPGRRSAEREGGAVATDQAYRVSDIDLASRLSFFLWSSIPDDELLAVAAKGTLSDRATLERQVRRMLADRRAQALVDNFASQWLTIGKLSGVVPDVDAYPEFDENLRDAFRQETRLFIGSQVREDRSVVDLVTANYSFVNERLARHYRIPNVYGSHFRRVTFNDGVRGGLLGQGSILTVTSYPNRTSPVLRGRWLLDNVLGAPPPPPPPDIPLLNEGGTDTKTMSIRQQMEAHRKNPSCAVCHVRMDPLGFSLENFDALGKWRTTSEGIPVDASGALPDGTKFEGVAGLRQLIASHQDDFARTFTQKLLAYALGRSLDARDLPAVRRIARDASRNGYRWSSVILGVATSTPFTMSTAQRPQSGTGTTTAPSASARLRRDK